MLLCSASWMGSTNLGWVNLVVRELLHMCLMPGGGGLDVLHMCCLDVGQGETLPLPG